MNESVAFDQYCRYTQSARPQPFEGSLSKDEFLALWHSLSNAERHRWEERFEMGFDKIISQESDEYARVLGVDPPSRPTMHAANTRRVVLDD
jgi:hypothetical protein